MDALPNLQAPTTGDVVTVDSIASVGPQLSDVATKAVLTAVLATLVQVRVLTRCATPCSHDALLFAARRKRHWLDEYCLSTSCKC